MAKPIVNLNECPFCGGKAQAVTFEGKVWEVHCIKCQAATGGYDSIFDAVTAWNKRVEGRNESDSRGKGTAQGTRTEEPELVS